MYYIIWGAILFLLIQTISPSVWTIPNQGSVLIVENNTVNNINKSLFFEDEIIDQNQSTNSGNSVHLANSSIYYAQRFQPQLNILSKIYVLISNINQSDQKIEFTIYLRKYLHSTIVKKVINIDNVLENATWVECDIGPVSLIQNQSYYIVCHVANASEKNYVNWFFGIHNPYPQGRPYYAINDINWEEFNVISEFPNLDFCFITKGFQNNKPQNPLKPDGPTSGQYGKEYTYSTSANDNNNDEIFFKWSWGDGEESEWYGPYQSGSLCKGSHIWMIKGSYLIKVKAKDSYGFESNWSEPLIIRMEKSKIFSPIKLWLTFFMTYIC